MNGEDNFVLQNRFIKKYKKNTIAVFLSFVLTITLITALLILIHTNFILQNIQWQRLFTPSDCSVNEISSEQVEQLKARDDISWYAVQQNDDDEYEINSQFILLNHGDDAYITLTGKLDEGSMPKNENEVVVERWTLLNMGVVPEVGSEFDFMDDADGTTRHVKVVGILSDQPANKKYGLKAVYTTMNDQNENFTIYLKFKNDIDYEQAVHEIQNDLGIQKEQIKKCPGRLDEKALAVSDAKIMGILIAISLIVFYGIYHIGMISRKKQYGILHAIGMTRRQIRRLILLELYEIFGVSIVFGVGIGYAIATLVKTLSGDDKQDIYLNNTKVVFSNVFPVVQISICVIVIALFVGIIGYLESRKIEKTSIISLISSTDEKHGNATKVVHVKEKGSKNFTLFMLGLKYILSDWKTSVFLVLTVCVGISLFTGLAYKQNIAKVNREDTKEMYFLNGQYEMASMWISSPLQGISREDAKQIEDVSGVTNVKTQAGFPVRIIDDKSVSRNEAYYEKMNQRCMEYELSPIMGNDGTDDILNTILYGYNTNALEQLKKYVIEGSFDSAGLKSDEIILAILRTSDKDKDSEPGYYKVGTSLMEYHVGDNIEIKYRKDFHTDSEEYCYLKDNNAEYCYKTYKVKAIVSFPYLYDCTHTLFPLMITDDSNIQQICPDSHIQQICLDGTASLDEEQQAGLERELISLGNKSENISTRSLISDIQENEMLYQKQLVYIIGIAAVSLILVLINIITNLKYRMVTRTKEICMFRAIGMSIKMIRKIALFENMTLFLIGSVLSYLILQPILRLIYHESDMQEFGHLFYFDYNDFSFIVFVVIVLCACLSISMTKEWKTKKIIEQIDSAV